MKEERYVITVGRAGVVSLKDLATGQVLDTWFNGDALLNATEILTKLTEEN